MDDVFCDENEIVLKEKILFIINPKAGTRSKKSLPDLIANNLDLNKFEYEITYTQSVGHATTLAKNANEKFSIVIATGGDGTVNEVMQGLIHSDVAMGILPFGSGNGLARFLGVPMDSKLAIAFINNAKIAKIDVGTVNDIPFVNVAGTGFDAHIGAVFATQKGRGLKTYITSSVKEFNSYESQDYELVFPDGSIEKRNAFLISFANSSQFGNNAHIAPLADIQDGLLDICVMKPLKWRYLPVLVSTLFTKKIHNSGYVEYWKTPSLTIKRKQKGMIHIDGEPHETKADLEIKVINKALKVLMGR